MAQIASDDTCFIAADAKSAFRHVEQIYAASGRSDNLELDYFEGGHEVDVEPGLAFLKKHLMSGLTQI